MRSVFAWATMALLLPINILAQSVNATVSGTITDVTGALIPAVTVTATNMETGVVATALSNETGVYTFPSLQLGAYRLTTSLSGFLPQIVEVQLGQGQFRIPFTLPLASVNDTVNVTAMKMDAMMATSSASVGFVLTDSTVSQLPQVGNDALSFVRMLPGVSPDGGATPGMMSGVFTFAGVPQIFLNTTRDGIPVTDHRFNMGAFGNTLINPDLVAEIRLVLAPVDAELGRGNGQVQIQTRSGTNRYTGAAVWNGRNSALNPNTWSNNANVDPFTQQWKPASPNWHNIHQYTLSYGGPIVKNKTFFFALWDQQSTYRREPVAASVMTPSARQGVFRYFEGWNPGHALTATNSSGANPIVAAVDLGGNPVAPTTNPDGTPYTGRLRCFSVFGNVKFDGTLFTAADCPGGTPIIASSAWNPLRPSADPTGYIRKILDRMPLPNYFGPATTGSAGDGLNLASYRWTRRLKDNVPLTGFLGVAGVEPLLDHKQINLKIDENFNDNHRLSATWSDEHSDAESRPFWPNGLGYPVKRSASFLSANVASTLSPNLLNEVRFGLRRQNRDILAPWEVEKTRDEALGYTLPGSNGYFALVVPGAGNYAFGSGSGNGIMSAQSGIPGGSKGSLYTYADTLSWTLRRHSVKFGAELRVGDQDGFGARPDPRVFGGAGGNPATVLTNANANLPNMPQTSRTDVTNMLYFLAGSVQNATMGYWIDSAANITNGTWEDSQSQRTQYQRYRLNDWSAFWKDDWKAAHNLTLNFGVRYEYYGSFHTGNGSTMTTSDLGDGLWGTFRTGGGNPFDRWLSAGNVYLNGYGPNVSAANALRCAPPSCDPDTLTTIELVGPHSPNPGDRLIPSDRKNFGPAVGFAWRLPWFGEGKTTVRGGYQITYGGNFGGTGMPLATLAGAGLSRVIVAAGYPGSASTANTISYLSSFGGQYLDLRSVPLLVPVRPDPPKPGQPVDIFNSAATFYAFDNTYATPYVQNLNLSVTRALRPNLSLDVRYVGTLSRKQTSMINLNISNAYHNKELFDALEATRAGGNALLFDQMLAGLNLTGGVPGYGAVGTVVSGVLQTGSAHLRRNGTIAEHLANGNFAEVARLLNSSAVAATGLQSLPQGLTGVGARLLRNGCDRIAAGQTTVGPNNAAPLRCFAENYIRANPQTENTYLINNAASSNYHSMQAQLMLRTVRGFTAMGTYTWSKDLGVPGLAADAVFNTLLPNYTDPSDRHRDYTYTNGHRAHDFRSSGIFELPPGLGRLLFGDSSGWLARLVEGWQTGLIFTVTSGARADISSNYGAAALPTGLYGSSVPDIVGPSSLLEIGSVRWNGNNNPAGTLHGGSYFASPDTFIKVRDPQCAGVTTADLLQGSCSLTAVALRNPDGSTGPIVLQNPKPGTRGSLGQNRIEVPGFWSFDANLSKTFQITESGWIKSLQFRMDATNLLNHPTPGLPDLNINSSSPFGIITTKEGTRSFQGQVRVHF